VLSGGPVRFRDEVVGGVNEFARLRQIQRVPRVLDDHDRVETPLLGV